MCGIHAAVDFAALFLTMSLDNSNQERWSPHHYAFAHRALLDLSVHLMSDIFSFLTEGPKVVIDSRLEALLEATDALIHVNPGMHRASRSLLHVTGLCVQPLPRLSSMPRCSGLSFVVPHVA